MLTWLIRFCRYNVYLGRDDFPNFRQTGNKIPHPVPKFWRIPLPWKQSNPESRQDIFRFPESCTVFWSNPGSREYPSRPWAKARHQVFHKVMCWIAIQIQRNSGWSFLCIFFDERGIAKSVVTNISMKNFFSKCVAGKRVLTLCQCQFPS